MQITTKQTLATQASLLLGLMSMSHLVNDAATSLLTPLLPTLSTTYNVSIGQTAILVSILAFVGAMLQPIGSIIGDRVERRWLAAGGPLLALLGMSLIGWASSFLVVGICIAVAGIGSALFHPAGVSLVADHTARARRGLATALFSAGGTLGLALGPLWATNVPMRMFGYALPVVTAFSLVVFWLTPPTRRAVGPRPGLGDYARLLRGPILTLWGMSVLRSVSTVAYTSLVGFMLVERGFPTHIGSSLAMFSAASAVGGIIGGRISDRIGRVVVLRSSLVSTVPLFIGLAYARPDQWWYYPLIALVGALVNANIPVTVVTAQEYAPNHVATASALMMGFSWGTAGVLFLVVGKLADYTSPTTALVASIMLLLPAFWLVARLPEPRRD